MRTRTNLLALAFVLMAFCSRQVTAQAPVDGYRVINQYPHDSSAFTQGLVLHEGQLYESTGLYGDSSLREVDLTTGTVLRELAVPSQYFAEGMTIFQGKLFQLTWQSQVGFIYDPETFSQIGQFSYSGEGWGLTHDDQHLIMSDGTNQIRFLDPVSLQVVGTVYVFDQGNPIVNINELEYVNGEIYANIWQTNLIARIDPASGTILGWIDLTGLLPAGTSADVLNGIAHEPTSGHLLVTGKFWPWLFEISLVGNSAPVAQNQSLTVAQNTSLGITLTATDADNDALTFSAVAGPAHGSLSGAPPNVTYTPAANYTGADTFTYLASDGVAMSNIATVSLTIVGSVPAISLSPASLSFGNQPVGQTSSARTVILQNPGTGPLIISSIVVTGPNAGDFSQSNSCGSVVAPGATCAINVAFKPTATGQRRGSIAIVDNAVGNPHRIALSGAGKKPQR